LLYAPWLFLVLVPVKLCGGLVEMLNNLEHLEHQNLLVNPGFFLNDADSPHIAAYTLRLLIIPEQARLKPPSYVS
jgi:hypothetical protein